MGGRHFESTTLFSNHVLSLAIIWIRALILRWDDPHVLHVGIAERHGVKLYIMYAVTNWVSIQQEIIDDWTNKMSAYTASPAYAHQNDMPVVCIWGFGFTDDKQPFTPAQSHNVVNWFKSKGLYLIGRFVRSQNPGHGCCKRYPDSRNANMVPLPASKVS